MKLLIVISIEQRDLDFSLSGELHSAFDARKPPAYYDYVGRCDRIRFGKGHNSFSTVDGVSCHREIRHGEESSGNGEVSSVWGQPHAIRPGPVRDRRRGALYQPRCIHLARYNAELGSSET